LPDVIWTAKIDFQHWNCESEEESMRHSFMLVPLALVSFVAVGCQRSEPVAQSMMHQVLGALQIPSRTERDPALATACRECAIAGDAESVLLGIPRIEDQTLRDEVLQDCVAMFVAANKTEVARKLVELITDPATRDAALRTLPG